MDQPESTQDESLLQGTERKNINEEENMEPPENPSRESALALREGLLLMDYELDGNGFMKPGTGNKFPLGASARDIGRSSVGMGVYLTSLQLFVMLNLLMGFLIGVPLMVMNKLGSNFTDNFLVRVNGKDQECPKAWASSDLVLEFTLGSYCPDNEFSSRFACPARCTLEPSILSINCTDLAFLPNGQTGKEFCNLERITEADGKAPFKPGSVPGAQLILLLISQAMFIAWLMFLKRTQALSADQINASVITAGDYSVMIQNLKIDSIENEHLIEVAAHYGEVASATHIATVGKPIELGLRLEAQQVRYDELKSHAQHPQKYSFLGSIGAFIYWKFFGGFKSKDKAVAAMEATMESTKEQLKDAQTANIKSTGCAVVTFNYEAHAKNMLRDHRRSALAKALGRLTCNFIVIADAPNIRGKSIRVTRAPEPTDIWWENTWVTRAERVKRRIISNFLALSVVALGAFIQFKVVSYSEADIAPVHEEHPTKAISKKILPLVTGVVVVVVNLAISILVNFLSFYECWLTRSTREKWLALKISTFYLVNSFFVPLLVQSTSKRRGTWYLKGGLMEQAFYIQLSNAILPDLLTLIDPMDALNVYFFSRFARTQRMLDNLLMPRQFSLSVRYAAAVKTMGLALFYFPVLPISPLIGALGLLISNFTDKYVALRLAQKPRNLAYSVTVAINNAILILPLVQMLLIWRLYFWDHPWTTPVFWTGLSIWLLFVLVPISRILKWDSDSKFGDWGTGGVPFEETIGKRARPTQASMSQSLMEVMTPEKPEGTGISLPEVYIPYLPPACSDGFKVKVNYVFEMPSEIHPANPELMQGQKMSTGGIENVRPPQRTSDLEFLPVVRTAPSQAVGTLDIISEAMELGEEHSSPQTGRGPGPPALRRLGSLPGVSYDVQAQIMHLSEGSYAPSYGNNAYPEIYFPAEQQPPSTIPYYPVIYHDHEPPPTI